MSKTKSSFMIIIERTIISNADRVEMNIDSTKYRDTLKEARALAKEEFSKGNNVEIWRLLKRY